MRIIRIAAVAGSAAALAVGLAPSAGAVTSVQAFCESGANTYYCEVFHDATSPYTIQWTINGTYVPALDNQQFIGPRNCTRNRPVTASVTVTDASGSLSDGYTFLCNPGPWP